MPAPLASVSNACVCHAQPPPTVLETQHTVCQTLNPRHRIDCATYCKISQRFARYGFLRLISCQRPYLQEWREGGTLRYLAGLLPQPDDKAIVNFQQVRFGPIVRPHGFNEPAGHAQTSVRHVTVIPQYVD